MPHMPYKRKRGEAIKNEPKKLHKKRYPARRWVVERTNSWHNRFRKLFTRYEKKVENYLGLVQLSCSIIIYRKIILGWALSFLSFLSTHLMVTVVKKYLLIVEMYLLLLHTFEYKLVFTKQIIDEINHELSEPSSTAAANTQQQHHTVSKAAKATYQT